MAQNTVAAGAGASAVAARPGAPRRSAAHGWWALVLCAWFLLPLLALALWLFADRWSHPAPLPQEWGFDGVESALAQGALPAFAASLGIGLAVSATATPLGVLAARALTYHPVPFRGLVGALLFAPLALPAFAAVFGLNVLLLRLHVPPTAGVVLVLCVYAIPYTTYIMRVAYRGHNLGFEEEARTLGASSLQVLWRVHLALLAPAIARSAFMAFLVGWTDYVVTLLLGGGTLITVPMLVASAASGTGNDAVVAALSLSALIPPLVLLLLFRAPARRGKGAS